MSAAAAVPPQGGCPCGFLPGKTTRFWSSGLTRPRQALWPSYPMSSMCHLFSRTNKKAKKQELLEQRIVAPVATSDECNFTRAGENLGTPRKTWPGGQVVVKYMWELVLLLVVVLYLFSCSANVLCCVNHLLLRLGYSFLSTHSSSSFDCCLNLCASCPYTLYKTGKPSGLGSSRTRALTAGFVWPRPLAKHIWYYIRAKQK